MLSHALINTFIATTDQNHSLERRKFRGERLIKATSLRRKYNYGLLSAAADSICPRRHSVERLQTFKDRFRLQDHALAAAERAVIHGAVLVFRKRPQIVNVDFHQARFPCPADNSVIQRPAKKVGKDRENVDLHRGNQSLVVRRWSLVKPNPDVLVLPQTTIDQ